MLANRRPQKPHALTPRPLTLAMRVESNHSPPAYRGVSTIELRLASFQFIPPRRFVTSKNFTPLEKGLAFIQEASRIEVP
jgi:hypothetical protein